MIESGDDKTLTRIRGRWNTDHAPKFVVDPLDVGESRRHAVHDHGVWKQIHTRSGGTPGQPDSAK